MSGTYFEDGSNVAFAHDGAALTSHDSTLKLGACGRHVCAALGQSVSLVCGVLAIVPNANEASPNVSEFVICSSLSDEAPNVDCFRIINEFNVLADVSSFDHDVPSCDV